MSEGDINVNEPAGIDSHQCCIHILSWQVSGVATGTRYMAINTERGVGPVVVDLQEVTQVHRFSFHSQAAAIGADDGTLVICADRLVLLYSLPLMERR